MKTDTLMEFFVIFVFTSLLFFYYLLTKEVGV